MKRPILNTKYSNNPFSGPLSRTTLLSRHEKKHALTPYLCECYTISFLHSLSSIASSLLRCQVWHFLMNNCSPGFLVFLYVLHSPLCNNAFFSPNHSCVLSFLEACPNHLFCCTTVTISSVPILSLNSLHMNLSVTLTPHIHLNILISAGWSKTEHNLLTVKKKRFHLYGMHCGVFIQWWSQPTKYIVKLKSVESYFMETWYKDQLHQQPVLHTFNWLDRPTSEKHGWHWQIQMDWIGRPGLTWSTSGKPAGLTKAKSGSGWYNNNNNNTKIYNAHM